MSKRNLLLSNVDKSHTDQTVSFMMYMFDAYVIPFTAPIFFLSLYKGEEWKAHDTTQQVVFDRLVVNSQNKTVKHT